MQVFIKLVPHNRVALENHHSSEPSSKWMWQCVPMLVSFYAPDMTAMDIRRHQRECLTKLISMSSFVQMILVTSLSMSFLVWIWKICGPYRISSPAALIQTASFQINCMLCGKKVYFRDVECSVSLTKINLGYVSQRLMLLPVGLEMGSKRF